MMRRKRRRTPTVLQMEAVECGAASLAMILAYYERWVPLEQLRTACGVSRNGAKASNILKAARQLGFEAKGYKKEMAEALSWNRPFIAFWNFNHYVVVEGAAKDRVFLNDPAFGPRRITRDEFDESYTGILLDFVPGPGFRKGGERRRLGKSLIARLGGTKSAMILMVLATIFLVVPGFLLPAFVKIFVDDVLTRGSDRWVLPLVIGLVLVTFFSTGLTILQQSMLLKLENRLGVSAGAQFFWRALRVPIDFYAQRYIGDIAFRLEAIQRVSRLMAGPLPTNMVKCITIGFYAAIMLLYSIPLTAATLLLTGCNLVLVQMVGRRRRELNMALQNQQAKLHGASVAGLQAIETIKAAATENDYFMLWSGYQTGFLNSSQRIAIYSIFLNSIPALINSSSIAVMLGFGGLLIIKGQLTIGGLLAFQLLLQQFNAPVLQLVAFGGQLQEVESDLNRLDDLIEHAEDPVLVAAPIARAEAANPSSARSQGTIRLSGAIELKAVSFAYSQFDPPLLRDFNLKIAPGQRVALVGATGSGKSSVAKLILGLYQPSSGEILFDGRRITDIPRESFATSVGAVMQEGHLFQGSILDNLTMCNTSIPRETVMRAAQDACIHEVVAALAGGYDSDLFEMGTNLSGGQRQRLEIARGLISDPAILVLDEATSALDPVTEQKIDDNLRRRGCTCVIIAHRLSTIRDCDEIIVLDRGRIIERGDHASLLMGGSKYVDLITLS